MRHSPRGLEGNLLFTAASPRRLVSTKVCAVYAVGITPRPGLVAQARRTRRKCRSDPHIRRIVVIKYSTERRRMGG